MNNLIDYVKLVTIHLIFIVKWRSVQYVHVYKYFLSTFKTT